MKATEEGKNLEVKKAHAQGEIANIPALLQNYDSQQLDLITLAYAIYRKDPVFITGQSIGNLVYLRNLMLIARSNQAASTSASVPEQPKGNR